MTVTASLRAAPIHVSDEVLDDLRRRLHATRWPVDVGNEDRYYGVDRATLERLTEHWRDGYDWRTAERSINRYEHWFVEIDGVPIHFMRVRGTAPNPTPVILTHGWPWTFWHWSKVVDALATPGTNDGPIHGFDVIVPSFPGFGFSSPLLRSDMSFTRVADLWHALMTDVLGFERYVAGGCDVGALVTGALGHRYPDELIAIHIGSGQKLTLFEGELAWDVSGGRPIPADLEPSARARLVELERRFAVHLAAQVLAPSTLGYGLTDSPAGMLAWILERWITWSDCDGNVESVFPIDDLLTHATIYWVTNSIATSIRTYANNNRYPWTPSHDRRPQIEAPTGLTLVSYENPPGITTDHRIEHYLSTDRAGWYNLVNIQVHTRGGHFIPWEIPNAWIDDLRTTVRIAQSARSATSRPRHDNEGRGDDIGSGAQ